MSNKIAFCFLTYDNIIRNDIWNNFFEDISFEKYVVFIHPKNIKDNDYKFNYNIVKNRIFTRAKDDITIVKATLKILEEAYFSDEKITHFIFLSQSCIPLYNFNTLYDIIIKFPYSVISSLTNNKTERYNSLSIYIKKYLHNSQFTKQQPNMILTNSDIQLLINNDYTEHFRTMQCPDEHYFINILLNVFKKHIIKKQINFCNFDFNRTQALEFSNVNKNFISQLREMGFLFMRKVINKAYVDVDFLLN
jgi:DNA-binding ferritin-like protein (Dps family)